jgi:hypothetical protein
MNCVILLDHSSVDLIFLTLFRQFIVGPSLSKGEPGKKNDGSQQDDNGDIVRQRKNMKKV